MDTSCQHIFEMIANCNTMIAINQNSIDEIQEKHNHTTTANIEQIDTLISNDVKDLNDRLNNIDTDCSSTDRLNNKLEEVAKVKESLKSLVNRVSSIEQVFILNTNRNKRMRESKKRKLDTTGDDSSPTSGVSSIATNESQDNSPPLIDQSSTATTKVSNESSSVPTPSPTPTGNNKRKRASGVSSSGQATSRGMFKHKSDDDKPKCSEPRCTRVVCRRDLCRLHAYGSNAYAPRTGKCSFPCCKANAHRLGLCYRHLYPCSIRGCTKQGRHVSDNGRFCSKHAQTEAPEVYAQYRHRINLWKAERWRTDPEFRLRMLVRGRLHSALKAQGTYYKGKNKLLGCTVKQFKRYFAQFFHEPGNDWMNWKNHGRQEGIRCWEIDHIYPLSELDLTDPEQLKRAQHWSNFQPLSAADNNEKKATIPDGFEWRDDLDRWWWSKDSGHINYELPAAGAEEVTIDEDDSDEFDESDDDDE